MQQLIRDPSDHDSFLGQNKKHWGLQLFIRVQIDELVKQTPGMRSFENQGGKLFEIEVEVDPTWTLKQLRQRIKEEMQQSLANQAIAFDFDSLDRMNVFVGEEGYGNEPAHRYRENMQMIYHSQRHNPNQTIEQLKVKTGSSLVFTLRTQTRPAVA